MHFGDWIAVVTNLVTAFTAVAMAILAYQAYLKAPEQEDEPESEIASENVASVLKNITVFKTSKQETVLRVTENGLECNLNDIRNGRGGHQWSIGRAEAKQIYDTANIFVNPGYKANTGTFSIGHRRNWLYSKKLFPGPDYLHGSLKELLKNAIHS